jgi:hypothetical protein
VNSKTEGATTPKTVEGVSEAERLRRSNIILCSALRQAHALIENGMEIRAKTLIGRVLDMKEVCK